MAFCRCAITSGTAWLRLKVCTWSADAWTRPAASDGSHEDSGGSNFPAKSWKSEKKLPVCEARVPDETFPYYFNVGSDQAFDISSVLLCLSTNAYMDAEWRVQTNRFGLRVVEVKSSVDSVEVGISKSWKWIKRRRGKGASKVNGPFGYRYDGVHLELEKIPEPIKYFKQMFNMDRFSEMLCYLHFNDNSTTILNRDHADYGRLCKVRLLLETFHQNCILMEIEDEQAINE
ncbi:hypothetical protein T4D_2278 [Trichinella pseudospiralis]|uniref:Uncharacterized protein n=1 Tax=Trichinella pseudospiralis TaxID=6337 RepID=A0A0V1FSX1_TRIPS|nr:hypothetical protein T4D_2278 [Trichinella pseudospiralis]